MFEWSDVRVFLAVQARGSFTAAAADLHMDQTTVGRRIAALEASLHAKLFRRGRDGLTLTAAGKEALASSQGMQDAAYRLDREVRGRDHAAEGAVRVTTVETLGARWLASSLVALRKSNPGIVVELSTGHQNSNLTRREADIAVRLGRPSQPGLIARRAGRIGYGLYASAGYVARHGRQIEDLAEHQVLGFDDDLSSIPEAHWLAARGVVQFTLRSNSVGVLENAAAAGLGVAVLPCYLANRHDQLVQLLGPRDVVIRDVWILVHAELQRQARIRVVVEHIASELERCAAMLAGSE